ncbi:MAG: YceD family protein [Limisphaerales bacterium]
MSLVVSLPAVHRGAVHLSGRLPPAEFDFDPHDPLVRAAGPLEYNLRAELVGTEVLVRGRLHLPLELSCARCLKPFAGAVDLPDYTLLVPLEGEDAVPVLNESVALTPFLREDSLLSLPTHPVCGETCDGSPVRSQPGKAGLSGAAPVEAQASPWAALANLKLD